MTTDKPETIRISPPNMRRVAFDITGTAPLMTARFSKKAEIAGGMQEGDTPAQGRKKRPPRDFDQDAAGAAYVAHEGWYGMNAAAFRNATISACRLVGFKMTIAKLSVFVYADGYDRQEGTPLVRILSDDPPITSVLPVRNATGVMDLRARPLWHPGWKAVIRMNFDGDQFSLTDISNLMMRVGMQVGIGEGRPDSRISAGMGYGLFEITGLSELR